MLDFAIATLTLVTFAFACGALLGYSSIKYRVEGNPVIDQINELLPQTQCGQCGYPGCKPYAEAIANGEKINRCPPGGEAGIKAIATLLNVDVISLDENCGEENQLASVVVIREDECIGCTKCIQACPVDAIAGAAKLMHTVIESECTGCDLCIPPCPVDCIDIKQVELQVDNWSWPLPMGKSDHNIPVKIVS